MVYNKIIFFVKAELTKVIRPTSKSHAAFLFAFRWGLFSTEKKEGEQKLYNWLSITSKYFALFFKTQALEGIPF